MLHEESDIFSRLELLIGSDNLLKLRQKHVILFGVGGVGGWCAESLIRSGITYLTIVDNDYVCASNINRQIVSSTSTIGRSKVEVMLERLKDINPSAEITAIHKEYNSETSSSFELGNYDYVIDAIDSLEHKAHLILSACNQDATLFSSMGAALKTDPSRIRVDEFWKAKGCPLARSLRNRFKRNKEYPSKKFKVVYSDEIYDNRDESIIDNGKRVNGTLCHAIGVFGFTLAGLVIGDIMKNEE